MTFPKLFVYGKFSKFAVGFLAFRMGKNDSIAVSSVVKIQNAFLFFSKMEKILNHMGTKNQIEVPLC